MNTVARVRRFALGVVVAFSGTWGLLAGCSSSEDDASNPDAAGTCPGTLQAAIGATCQSEGFQCPIAYQCGQFLPGQAYCTCTSGKFACVDTTGNPITDYTAAPCTPPNKPADGDCPSSQAAAEGSSCKTTWLQCFYSGVKCPENANPNTDVCICAPKTGEDGGTELKFRCEARGCVPKSDASTPPLPDATADSNG